MAATRGTSSSSSTNSSDMSRCIDKVVPATVKTVGPSRLIGTLDCDGNGTEHDLAEVDPFILLDAGTIAKDGMPPFGPHPHRGHSVVTILLNGRVKSWDSFQEQDQSREGRNYNHIIQGPASYWVDAGTGVFHDEVVSIKDESDPSQHAKLFQLWVGVSERDRNKPPRVQFDENLPVLDCLGYSNNNTTSKDGAASGQVTVGTVRYHVGPKTSIETPHPITVAHIQQKKGTTYRYPIESTMHGGFAIHVKGNPSFGDEATAVKPQREYDVLVLKNSPLEDAEKDGRPDWLQVTTSSEEDAEYVIATGERIGEQWAKKLVANGAVIAATPDKARELAPMVQEMSKAGFGDKGSFAPFGR